MTKLEKNLKDIGAQARKTERLLRRIRPVAGARPAAAGQTTRVSPEAALQRTLRAKVV